MELQEENPIEKEAILEASLKEGNWELMNEVELVNVVAKQKNNCK